MAEFPDSKLYYKPENNRQSYYLPITLSILLHCLLFLYLFTQIDFNTNLRPVLHKSNKIVKAVTINQQQVNKEIAKIKAQQSAKKKTERARVQRLQRLARSAKRQRVREANQITKLRKEQKRAESKITAFKKEQAAAQKRLKQLQQQAKKQYAAIEKKKLAEKRKKDASALLQKQLKAEQKQLSAAKVQYMQGVVNKYKALILHAIERQWLVPNNVNKNLSCELAVKLAPGGDVLNVSVTRSSGDQRLDRSAVTAVYKASPLPVPTNTNDFDYFRSINLTVRPESVVPETNAIG